MKNQLAGAVGFAAILAMMYADDKEVVKPQKQGRVYSGNQRKLLSQFRRELEVIEKQAKDSGNSQAIEQALELRRRLNVEREQQER